MSFEKYTQFYYSPDEGRLLRPKGKAQSFSFDLEKDENKSYKLFVAGETGLFYLWKNEPDHPIQYRSIVDSLSTDEAEGSHYAVSFSSKKPEKYIRRIYKKILWRPRLSYLDLSPLPENFTVGFFAKARELRINEGGYVRMRVLVRYTKDGVSRHDTRALADEEYTIEIPEGSYGYTEFSRELYLPKARTASVGIFIEGVNYSGEVYVERPHLLGGGHNILPDFGIPVQGKEHFEWTGQYMSRKEWPEFRVHLNGTNIFEGEIFERCHRDSEWEIALPSELLRDKNELSVELISDYHDPLPYTVHELGIIEQCGGELSLIASSEIGVSGGYAYALIRTAKPNTELTISCDGKMTADKKVLFAESGLHGIRFCCKEPAENAEFCISDGKTCVRGAIKRIVIREPDGVYTGTGDMIYVHQDRDSFEEYLSWYLSEGIGNLLTIRPAYRWSGTRTLDSEAFSEFTRVLNEWGIVYSHMLDGRELEGLNANPDEETIAGKGFLGRQLHERDGAMFYWQRYTKNTSATAEQFYDMEIEICREDPTHSNPVSDGSGTVYVISSEKKKDSDSNVPTFEGDEVDSEKIYNHKNPNIPKDMKIAHDYTLERLRQIKHPSAKRHTGPSVTFKYFYEAGFDWAGAETMYGTLEEIMAFQRGAAQANEKRDLGVHHALQWSSSPHEAPEHVRRFRLALYVSYMQGATEINTEEGLWRLEEFYSRYNRFSDTCIRHKAQQQDFYRYVASHTRRGEFYTPMALIHGRYDGFHGFSRNGAWGFKALPDTDAERSWDLLSTFYPEGTLGDATYCHNCPTDRPVGFQTSTPIGNIDAIPIEAPTKFGKYGAIAFMAYNCYEKADFDALYDYVSGGGHLLLTLAHLTSTTEHEKLLSGDLSFSESALSFLGNAPRFGEHECRGKKLTLLENCPTGEVVLRTDDGAPLAIRYKLGDGEVTLFTTTAFPADPAIDPLYRDELRRHMLFASSSEWAYAESSDKVGFAIYDRGDERDIYFLAVDWYSDPERLRTAKLRIGSRSFDIALPFGTMVKATVSGEYGAVAHSEAGEVISVRGGVARLQGTGKLDFTLISGDVSRTVTVDFTNSATVDIKL